MRTAGTALFITVASATVLAGQTPEALGTVDFETSCAPAVRASFDHAVALLHHMTYAQAQAEFAEIASADPACAMAHWGIAMTLFQPLWPTRPTPADLERGRNEVEIAQSLQATGRETLFIAATAAFFDPAAPDYAARIRGWAAGTETLAARYPEDHEVLAFLALSRLAAGSIAGDASGNAAAADILTGILRDEPTHPGAIHYLIHANDANGREHESLDVVRRYAEIAPRNPHALHMPTHIWTRLGDWQAVIDGNTAAADAALAHPAGDRGQWVWDEYPHAVEYLVYAALQQGDDAAAREAMTRLQRTQDLQPSFKTAFHLTSIPARYTLERHDWTGAMALEPRPSGTLDWSRFPWPESITWFAKGMGAARSGDAGGVATAEARITALRDASEALGEIPFSRQSELLRRIVHGWGRHLAGDAAGAIASLREAVELEASLPKPPVTPAPTLPAAEVLGDLLMEVGRPQEALAAYRTCLESAPGRFDSLVGAARAARALGDDGTARQYYATLLDQVVADSPRPEVAEARAFLARPGRSSAPSVCDRCERLTGDVSAFLNGYLSALSARDTAAVRAAYIDDDRFAWIERGGVQYRSVDDVLAGLAEVPPGPVRTDLADLEVSGVGDTGAIARMRFTTTIGSGDQAFSFGGLMTIVLERDDRWRIVTGHVSEAT